MAYVGTIPLLERIKLVEKEANRVHGLLKMAWRQRAGQSIVDKLGDRLTCVCDNLATLYGERDAAVVAAKLAKLQERLTNRSVTITPMILSTMDLDRKPPRPNPKRRYVAKGERSRGVSANKKPKSGSDKGGKRQRQMVA